MENFNIKAYESLSQDSRQKVDNIFNIADMLEKHKLSPLNTKDFDNLYDKSLSELEDFSGQVADRLNVIIQFEKL